MSESDRLTAVDISADLEVPYLDVLAFVAGGGIAGVEKINGRRQVSKGDFNRFRKRNQKAIQKLETEYISLYWQGLEPDRLQKRVADDFSKLRILARRTGFTERAIYRHLTEKARKV